jgi:hypothetical protein
MRAATTILLFLFLCMAVPRNVRAAVFAITANPRNSEKATIFDWMNVAADLREADAKGIVITKTWSSLEPSKENYNLHQLAKDIGSNIRDGREVFFGFQPINTTKRDIPSDLEHTRWDDPALIERYRELLDHLASESPAQPKYISIGNEVDIYFQKHPDEFSSYLRFYKAAYDLTHLKFPDSQIGVTVTHWGILTEGHESINQLLAISDIAIFTYYPLKDLDPLPLDQIENSLDAIVLAAQGKPVVLQEIGFPSGTLVGSSEEMQAAFLTNIITGIKARPEFTFASIFLLHDFSPAFCDQLAGYFGVSGSDDDARKFRDVLCTLGLRKSDGQEKLAWRSVVDALK